MVALGRTLQDQLNRLGLTPDAFGAQLDGVATARLKALTAPTSDGLSVVDNRFSAELRDGRRKMAKAFFNPNPQAARRDRAPFLEASYFNESTGGPHPSSERALRFLLHPRRTKAARLTRALQNHPELRNRVSTQLGAMVSGDGRADGVISVRRDRPAAPAQSAPQSGGPAPTGGNTIWEIMLAMDEAILQKAKELGLDSSRTSRMFGGGGTDGSMGYLEAMGLWALKPDEDSDPTAWVNMLRGGSDRQTAAAAMSQVSPPPFSEPTTPSESTDVEIMQIKRQIDKKTQMMELYSQAMSKYNSSANNIINNLK